MLITNKKDRHRRCSGAGDIQYMTLCTFAKSVMKCKYRQQRSEVICPTVMSYSTSLHVHESCFICTENMFKYIRRLLYITEEKKNNKWVYLHRFCGKLMSNNNKLRKGFSHNKMNKRLFKGTFLNLSPKLSKKVWISASWKPFCKITSQIYVDPSDRSSLDSSLLSPH